MDEWWYIKEEKEVGPRNIEEIIQYLNDSKINTATLIWKKGMDNWKPLNQVTALNIALINSPPPIPSETNPNSSVFINYSNAGAWRRFFARFFDVFWQNTSLGLLLGFVITMFNPGFVDWINKPGSEQVFNLFTFPLALVMDAIIQGIWGTSPGKALLGIRVINSNGAYLSIFEHIERNLSLWVRGLGLGIPIVYLFTAAHQAGRLRKGKSASYDEAGGYLVKCKPINWYQYIFFTLSFLVLILGVITLIAL